MSTKSSPLVNIGLLFGSVIFFLLLAEGGSRLFFKVRWGELYRLQSNVYSLHLGWTVAQGDYKEFTINNQGFRRSTDTDLAVPESTVRIFLLGGSTAFGTNGLYTQFNPPLLEMDETIDAHLEDLLSTRYPAKNFEVINAAVPEYRLFQEHTLLREKLVYFNPDAVVFLDGHNDISMMSVAPVNDPTPWWNSRHVIRGERVLNSRSIFAPVFFADLYMGRKSYFYYGLSRVLQSVENMRSGPNKWGEGTFQIAAEPNLRQKYSDEIKQWDQNTDLYLTQVGDLHAVTERRGINVVYVLQPEVVLEDQTLLTDTERNIQDFAFVHHREMGTLAWRHLAPVLATAIDSLSSGQFRFLDLSRIGHLSDETLYTDYTHLTSEGNRLVAEQVMPIVIEMLELDGEVETMTGTDHTTPSG